MNAPLTRLERWDLRLKSLFDQIDAELENYTSLHLSPEALAFLKNFPLHPARPPANSTANPEDDGHFDLGAAFTVGIGSTYGPGYVLTCRIATLSPVPADVQTALEDAVATRLRQLLPSAFPHTELALDRDPAPAGPYKLHGNLSLD